MRQSYTFCQQRRRKLYSIGYKAVYLRVREHSSKPSALVVVDSKKAEQKRTQEPAGPLRVSQWGHLPHAPSRRPSAGDAQGTGNHSPQGDHRCRPSPSANPSGLHGQLKGCVASLKAYLWTARGLHHLPEHPPTRLGGGCFFKTPFSYNELDRAARLQASVATTLRLGRVRIIFYSHSSRPD